MADHDRNPHSFVGRDADAAGADPAAGTIDSDAQAISGDDIADQLNQTTSEDAGGNVSGTAANEGCEDLDIIFEPEVDEDTRH